MMQLLRVLPESKVTELLVWTLDSHNFIILTEL